MVPVVEVAPTTSRVPVSEDTVVKLPQEVAAAPVAVALSFPRPAAARIHTPAPSAVVLAEEETQPEQVTPVAPVATKVVRTCPGALTKVARAGFAEEAPHAGMAGDDECARTRDAEERRARTQAPRLAPMRVPARKEPRPWTWYSIGRREDCREPF